MAGFLSWHKYPGEKRLPNVAGIMKTHKLRFRAVAFCSRSSRLSIDKRQCELFQTFMHNVVASLRDRKGYTTVPVSRYSHPPWPIDYRFVPDVLTEFSTYTSFLYVYLPSYCEINEELLTFPIVHL